MLLVICYCQLDAYNEYIEFAFKCKSVPTRLFVTAVDKNVMRLTINTRMIIEQPQFENFNCTIALKNSFGSISEHHVVFTYLCDNNNTYDLT